MNITITVHANRLEFEHLGLRASISLDSSPNAKPWMTDFRSTAAAIREGLSRVATGAGPFRPPVTVMAGEGLSRFTAVEKSALEASALIGGAGAVTIAG